MTLRLECVCGRDSAYTGEFPPAPQCPHCEREYATLALTSIVDRPEDGRQWTTQVFEPLE